MNNRWLKSKREEVRAFDNLGKTKDLLAIEDLRSWGMQDTISQQITEAGTRSIQTVMSHHQEQLWGGLIEAVEEESDGNHRGKIFEGIDENGVWNTLNDMLREVQYNGGKRENYRFYGTPRVINKLHHNFHDIQRLLATSTGTIRFQGIPLISVKGMPRDTLFLAHENLRNDHVKGLVEPICILKIIIGERIEFQVNGTGDMDIEVYSD